jgi:endonuclease/exonuclease/phosphatase family metal-dependent hydrolase
VSRLLTVTFASLVLALSSWGEAQPQPTALRCLDPVPGVTRMRWTESSAAALDQWCASVGPPVLMSAPAGPAEVNRLVIVSWNVHVGGGRVKDLVETLWKDEPDHRRTGMVLLLQEVFRAGQDVPESWPQDLRVPAAIRPSPRSSDVTGLARQLGMAVAYVPSMRNGPGISESDREDRGNAILSTEPLSDARAIELPFGKQRRVALAATITPRGSAIPPLRVIVSHFDTSTDRVAQAEALGRRITELGGMPVVLGGDFNSRKGLEDPSVQAIGRRLPMEPCGTGKTSRWPLRLDVLAFFVGRLDFILSTLGSANLKRECQTMADPWGSDHLPLVLTVQR